MTQHGPFQVKAVFLQITKHFLDPHSAGVGLQSHLPVRKVRGQTPRFIFSNFPVHQQVHRINLRLRQPPLPQPHTAARPFDPAPKIMPLCLPRKTNVRTAFLAQNVVPMPSFQLLQHFHCSKFAVSNQQNGDSSGQKASDIRQQSQLSIRCAVPFSMLDPCPGNRNSTFPICQTNDQQLMSKANFGPIHNQPHLVKITGLTCQPAVRNRFIPCTHIYRRVSQQSAQALDQAEQLRLTRHLSCNPAQIHRTALVNSYDQPGKILDAGFSFRRLQLSNSYVPSMIETVDRQGALLFLFKQISGVHFSCRSTLFLKVYGG